MRLGIFLFYDGEGHVSDHVVYLLAKFSEHLDRLLVVVNGSIRPGDEERIAPYADQIIVRNNTGFDVGGYIDGIMSIGFDDLASYDELVLFNYTVFGPMFDLDEMFSEMATRDVDFWGVTEFHDKNKEFLQSYFLVTRKSLHASSDFRDYWLNMPRIAAVDDSVKFHEFRFTPHFAERGYKKGVYIENEVSWQGNTTLLELEALLAKRLPILKYRAFNFDASAIERRGGMPAAANYALIAEQTDYPVDFIWDYILSQTKVDQIIDSITTVAITDQPGRAGEDLHAHSGAVVFLSVEDEPYVERLASYFEAFDVRKLFVVSSNERICSFFESRGWTTQKSARPMTGAPICAFADRLQTIVSEDDMVFNLSCFFQERDNYRFREFLIENYWGPLLSSATTLDTVSDTFRTIPRIGLTFAPTESVFGRTTRFEPLCPRASNWTFDDYPKEARWALNQANWPWRGNAALSARLVLDQGFISVLMGLQAQIKHGSFAKIAGIEGVIAELARGAGYASKLAMTQQQAVKLVARGTLKERDYRNGREQQAKAFSNEVTALRAHFAQATTAKIAAALPVKPQKAAEGDLSIANLQATVTRAELRAAEAEAALDQARQIRERQNMEWEKILDHLTPLTLRNATAMERSGDALLVISQDGDNSEQRAAVTLTLAVVGSIDTIRREKKRIQIKGWCYNRDAPNEMMFVAVAQGGRFLKSFSPCLLQRINLAAKIGRQLPHEHSGFALSVPLDETLGNLEDLVLVLSSGHGDRILMSRLKEGVINAEAPADQPAVETV